MTSRQAGRRMATISAQRKRQTGRSGVRQPGRRKDESMRPKERRQFLQLVICCGIFVLLVAAKFLLPSRMAQINEVLSRAMEQNMDVQAVFSAVGRAFSGESGMSGTVDEVYRAVFHPDGTEEALETSAHIPASQGIAAMAALQAYLPWERRRLRRICRRKRRKSRFRIWHTYCIPTRIFRKMSAWSRPF